MVRQFGGRPSGQPAGQSVSRFPMFRVADVAHGNDHEPRAELRRQQQPQPAAADWPVWDAAERW